MQIKFDKMEGAGNDFIMIDNRSGEIPDAIKIPLAQKYCRRALGIGADGVIIIEPDPEFDFSWDFFNADGSRGEMCGNGARCAARYANIIGAAGKEMTFRTVAGPIAASLTDRGAKVRLTSATLPPKKVVVDVQGRKWETWNLNTGVPHAMIEVPDLEQVDVFGLGRAIRNHQAFAPAGTNVNFFKVLGNNKIAIRTYERGVENETLACGTGSAAASIVTVMHYGLTSPVTVVTRSGEELVLHFTLGETEADPVFLEGGASVVFSGTFSAPTL